MRIGRIVVVVSLAVVALGLSSLGAQTPRGDSSSKAASQAYRFRVLGVFDEQSGEPIEGVEVSDLMSGNKSLTTNTGTVSLFFMPDGGGFVRVRKVGYEMQTITVAIAPNLTTPITVVLRKATTLPTVVVSDSAPRRLTPGLRNFEENKKLGFGQFITEAELRKADNRNLSTLLTGKLTGLQAVQAPHGFTYLASSRKPCKGSAMTSCRQPNCFVTVYLDGTRIFDASMTGATVPDFSRMNVADYAAVEFYPSEEALPAGITATNADCGTLVLYSRDR